MGAEGARPMDSCRSLWLLAFSWLVLERRWPWAAKELSALVTPGTCGKGVPYLPPSSGLGDIAVLPSREGGTAIPHFLKNIF